MTIVARDEWCSECGNMHPRYLDGCPKKKTNTNKSQMKNEEEASKKACELIRKQNQIPKHINDADVIDTYKDEWSWFMQGWRETNKTQSHQEPKPLQSDNPNLEKLRTVCQGLIDSIDNGNYHEDEDNDDEHYIYEAAMEALYGKDVWNYINERT